MNGCATLLAVILGVGSLSPPVPAAETGMQTEVVVKHPTRLDWAFVAADFGAEAARLPRSYQSSQQRYQLYVPPEYSPDRAWPVVVFISPGDDPLGWPFWRKVCEDRDVFFCAAYGAGNNTPPGLRIRMLLDMFDDVRRRYRIDPDRTYLAGFSGGGRLACTIAFALPEYFGGVVPICGSNPLHRLDYLQHRVRDRVSVAFVTGEKDVNRREYEAYRAPLFAELGIRSRLWMVPKIGHDMPPEDVLAAVHHWLEEDLPRRQKEARERPGLAVSPNEVPTDRVQAERLLAVARQELFQPDRVYQGTAMLLGLVARWSDTDAGDQARALLKEIREDPVRRRRLVEQGGAEDWRKLSAEARARERFGQLREARQAWQLLVKSPAAHPEAAQAAEEMRRLETLLAALPYLGVRFEGESTRVKEVVRRGPADHAGLTPGDHVQKLGRTATPSLTELRRALQAYKPGDKLVVEVLRDGNAVTLTFEVGALPQVVQEK
jgi:pimeloyl-ACP methyl ester carboxylesterase